MAAVPETYFTAWGSLFECLHLRQGETLLIRGVTCALGYAAAQLARALGCHVIATTYRKEKRIRSCWITKDIFLTGFYSYCPSQEIMNDIFAFLDQQHLSPEIGSVYSFKDLRQACMDLDHHKTNGKIIVDAQ